MKKKDSVEELKNRLHELSVMLVKKAKEDKKLKTRNELLIKEENNKKKEENDLNTMYVPKEIYNEYYGLLHELEMAFRIAEYEAITMKYNSKKKETGILYGGNGEDYDGYGQCGAIIVDQVTDEEIEQRKQKENELNELMNAEQELNKTAKEKSDKDLSIE